jgi:hypothetical protein
LNPNLRIFGNKSKFFLNFKDRRNQMLKFDDGYFVRTWKHGGHDMDPAWIAAEKTTVNAACASILRSIPTLMTEVNREMANAMSMQPLVIFDVTYLTRWNLWIGRMTKTAKMLSDMQTDLGRGGKTINVRKATDLKVADQISALCEFEGSTPRWVISVNGNAADPTCYFFGAANAAKSTVSLFHEVTHLYGTEDSGVMDIENAHQLEPLLTGRAVPHMRALLAKQRQFTMNGDTGRTARGTQMTMARLKVTYGPANCWDKAGFAKTFTGDPINGIVKRISDGQFGNLSIVWDEQNRPLYFFNFR